MINCFWSTFKGTTLLLFHLIITKSYITLVNCNTSSVSPIVIRVCNFGKYKSKMSVCIYRNILCLCRRVSDSPVSTRWMISNFKKRKSRGCGFSLEIPCERFYYHRDTHLTEFRNQMTHSIKIGSFCCFSWISYWQDLRRPEANC